jgi:hypothetical protein
VNAELADSKASIVNEKEYVLDEGNNTIELVVTAEDGSEKKYTINAKIFSIVIKFKCIMINVGLNALNAIKYSIMMKSSWNILVIMERTKWKK